MDLKGATRYRQKKHDKIVGLCQVRHRLPVLLVHFVTTVYLFFFCLSIITIKFYLKQKIGTGTLSSLSRKLGRYRYLLQESAACIANIVRVGRITAHPGRLGELVQLLEVLTVNLWPMTGLYQGLQGKELLINQQRRDVNPHYLYADPDLALKFFFLNI